MAESEGVRLGNDDVLKARLRSLEYPDEKTVLVSFELFSAQDMSESCLVSFEVARNGINEIDCETFVGIAAQRLSFYLSGIRDHLNSNHPLPKRR